MTPAPHDLLRQLARAATDPAVGQFGPAELAELLGRVNTPAPPPPHADAARPTRWQDDLIESRIPHGASVLDLGCGEGELLARLIRVKAVRGQGVELDADQVFRCVERGVPVYQSDLDGGLKGFADDSFDYVVLEETLQTLHHPTDVLQEMLRVGRRGIVSFPNFAHWRVRLDLSLRGRMPITQRLPWRWYNTPNIHLLSLQDFLDWTESHRVRIAEAHVLCEGAVRPLAPTDNLYAEEALFVVEKQPA